MLITGTRNVLTSVGTAAIACGQEVSRSLRILVDAIAVVFTNVRTLRVVLACPAHHRLRACLVPFAF